MERLIEINRKQSKAGRTPLKLVLHKIHNSQEEYNENGCSWNRQYTEDNKYTVSGMPLVCQFLDEEQTIPFGAHGDCEFVDGEAVFKNSLVVGGFEDSYIDDNLLIDGERISGHVANAYIYDQRFPHLLSYLEGEIAEQHDVKSSVEIYKAKSRGLDAIVYEDGYKEKGRVPKLYDYSACALTIGVRPSDSSAVMLEINSAINQKKESEETDTMDEKILAQFVDSIKTTISEVNSKNGEYEKTIEDLNKTIVETNASVETIQAALDTTKEELTKKYEEIDSLYKELELLRDEIAKAKVKEKVGELNSAISAFSDDEKAFAKDEITAFEADPMSIEINSIVDKIYKEVGKKAKEDAAISETNAANKQNEEKLDDIFADVLETNSSAEYDDNIF